ncbi:MAG: DUF2723 domain-containing protein [Bacteroidetes bacterium]|nr:DUF2723 domain-containing protein [Bacteroidota bacterium]
MNKYQKLNNIFGWVTFAIAAITFLLTIEPTASWWDPGEFISTTYKLQVGHPPGAPTMQMVGRLFTLLAFGNTAKVAMMVNAMSGLCSAFAVLFLFWSITMFARKIVAPKGEMTREQMYTIFAAGFVGALAFCFSDSFWFSAVEGEVYAMSAMFTALVFWAILKWETVADQGHASRWLIFIAFMVGLAIGVHLLNLLTIPALAFVIYYKKYKPTKTGILVTLILSVIVLAFIMYIVIPWIPTMAGKFEMLFVNGLGLRFNSGTIAYFILLTCLIGWGLYYTRKNGKPLLNTIILSFVFLLFGYSSFMMLVIRANAGTPINENAPKDAVSLVSFLNREQYGTWPLLKGQYYNAPIVDYSDSDPIYGKDEKSGKYVILDERKGTVPVYDPGFTTIFPRMWSSERKGTEKYFKDWAGPGVPTEATDRDGKTKTLNKPTFGENLKFFFNYQVGWMYLRYFMWNYSGRQNDIQGYGGVQDGNWITGISFLDNWRLGNPQSNMPDSMKNQGTNKYYLLPLLLGFIGFLFQMNKDNKGAVIVTLLFLMTGLAIVVYLNQKPYEPRERDYSYCGSTYAFAVWIGLGVIWLINVAKKYLKKEMLSVILVGLLCLLLVPGNMAKENWDDHDRSDKYSCRDLAANYLNSCDKQGILFTNGDNDTFPLWYDQEVEGIRTDVRVVNLMLASGSWYMDELFKKAYDSEALPFTMEHKQYQIGSNDYIPYYDIGMQGYTELKDFIEFLKSDNPQTYIPLNNGEKMKFFPTKKLKLTVDSAACIKYGIVPKYFRKNMVDTIYWTIKTNNLFKNDIMMLDLIASSEWKRPFYFAAPSSVSHCFNVDTFCLLEGWAYKFMPVKGNKADYISGMGGVDPIGSYDVLMHKCAWGNLNDPRVYVDPESLNEAIRPKTAIVRVSQSLMDMGRVKEAVELMDLYFKYLPGTKFIYDMYNLPFAEMYFKAGETGKTSNIIERLGQIYSQNLNWYYAFSGSNKDYYKDEIQTSLAVLRKLNMLATQFDQPKLAAKMENLFNLELKGYK